MLAKYKNKKKKVGRKKKKNVCGKNINFKIK